MSVIQNPALVNANTSLGWIDVYSYLTAAQQVSVSTWTGVDVTAAVTTAIAAIPSTGGVLYFRPGRWVTSGGFTLSVPFTVMGGGSSDFDLGSGVTQIECTSTTAVMFTVTAKSGLFKNLALVCTAASPSAGSGIFVNGSYESQRIDYYQILVSGFYDNIDVKVGGEWTADDVQNYSAIRYGFRVRNTVTVDSGDWTIKNCHIYPVSSASAGIRYESSGGGRIINNKILTIGGGSCTNGISMDVGSAVSVQTLILGNSIEGVSAEPILITKGWPGIVISQNYLSAGGTSAAINAAYISEFYIGGNILLGAGANAIDLNTQVSSGSIDVNEQLGFTNNYTVSGTGFGTVRLYWDANPIFLTAQTASYPALYSDGNTGGFGNKAILYVTDGAGATQLAHISNMRAHAFQTDGSRDSGNAAVADSHDLAGTSLYLDAFNAFQLVFDNANNYGMLSNKTADQWWFGTSSNGTTTETTRGLGWAEGGSALLGLGGAALATSATDGFAYIPTCAGPPTGTPTAYTGKVPLVYDTTGDEIGFYNGQWNMIPAFGTNRAPTVNKTLKADYSEVVVDHFTIAASKTLTLAAGSTMRIL